MVGNSFLTADLILTKMLLKQQPADIAVSGLRFKAEKDEVNYTKSSFIELLERAPSGSRYLN